MHAMAVGLLFIFLLATPVDAAVIHTVVNETFVWPEVVSVDLNHDGLDDVVIQIAGGAAGGDVSEGFVAQQGPAGGGVTLTGSNNVIGPGTAFAPLVETGDVSCRYDRSGGRVCSGIPFSETFFVGVQFPDVESNLHYGWLRIGLDAHFPPSCCPFDMLTGTLQDYAYETVPNTPITTPAVPEPVPPFAVALAVMLYGACRADRAKRNRNLSPRRERAPRL